MSESIESYLDDVRAEAWSEHVYPLAPVDERAEPPKGGRFERVTRVYERELRKAAEERTVTVRVADESLQAASKARDIAYEMLEQLINSCPEREDVLRIIAELDKVLGPDLVREADPTGEVLRPLPFDERKQMLDALDRAGLPEPRPRGPRAPGYFIDEAAGLSQVDEQARGEGE